MRRICGTRWIGFVAGLLLGGLAEAGTAQTWVELTPAEGAAPEARTNAAAVYDADGHRMIVFGGRGASGDFNDVWAFDLSTNTWAEITPAAGEAPAPRRTPSSIYDAESRRMLMWSGQGAGFFNDVWAFDLAEPAWTAFEAPEPRPNTRYGVASVRDPETGQLVTFAGFTDAGRFEDTWAFDPATGAWTDVSPASGNPGRRCLHSASYDARDHRMIMYGGQRSGALDDIWAFDLDTETWTDLTPAERPAGRYFTAHVYDARNHRAVIFGGFRSGGAGRTDEVWAFDLDDNSWQLLVPDGTAPSARDGATGIYVEHEDRMIVFGGRAGAFANDVWALEDLSGTGTATEIPETPAPLRLDQNYPNPVRGQTTISFTLPAPAHATLSVFDVRGREVARVLAGRLPAQRHDAAWDATGLPAGVYFYRLRTPDFVETRRLVVR